MKAVVYGGPGQRSWTDVSEPKIVDPRDAVIQVDAVTICGTDLHILKGDVPAVQPGRILGHEAVGTVVDIGGGVTGLVEATASSPPASPPVASAPTAARVTTASAAMAAAGSSVTSSTASRPSSRESRSPTCPPTGCPRASATRPPR